jgi:hypothetical protein
MRNRAVVILAALALFAGCENEHAVFEIRLRPKSDGIERSLTAWRERSRNSDAPNKPLVDAEVARLAKLYAERTTGDSEIRQTFRGTFVGKLPADVGGRGTFEISRSPLGTCYTYLERFRGDTDIDAQLYDRRAAVDRLCDLVVAWFDEQLAGKPEQAAVKRFLHQEFRQDVRNISAMFYIARGTEQWPDENADESAKGPIGQRAAGVPLFDYLAEHDYVQQVEFPVVAACLQPDDREAAFALVRKMLARKAKLPAAAADSTLAFLRPSPEFQESWSKLLRGTPEFAQLRKLHEAERRRNPEVGEPAPEKVLENLLTASLFGDAVALWQRSRDEVRVSLELPGPPHDTNGTWDAETKTLRWRRYLSDSGPSAVYCYAQWAVPDEAFQHAHFGRTAVVGEQLASVAQLYRSLAPERRTEIDKHLRSLEPGDAIKGRAQDFRFVGETDDVTDAVGRELIEIVAREL